MAASSYSSDVLQRYNGRIDEAIQSLPMEIREKIYKELVSKKMRERKEMGWNEVNDLIKNAPFCEKRLIITNVIYCFKWGLHGCGALCELCLENGETHYLNYSMYEEENYEENFMRFHYLIPSRYGEEELNYDEILHYQNW